jgi:hypothetical protein
LIVVFTGVAIVALAAVVFVVVKKKKGKKRKTGLSLAQFQLKAVSAGFTALEGAMLCQLAVAANLDNPMNVFWSYKSLDVIIKSAIEKFYAEKKDKIPANQDFLGKLLLRRKQLTIQKINNSKHLSDTKEIPSGQPVKVVLTGLGIFTTHITDNSADFSVLSPIVFDLPVDFEWTNRKVTIFFHRRDDGEYSFSTTVIRETEDRRTGEKVLLLGHQNTLSCVQKRKSIRIFLNKHADIYPAGESTGMTFATSRPCILHDLSDDGCSVVMDGKADFSRTVIVQFQLCNQIININGDCRSVHYNQAKNLSLLHIKAGPIVRESKNIILAVMFGVMSDSAETTHEPLSETGAQADAQTDAQAAQESQPDIADTAFSTEIDHETPVEDAGSDETSQKTPSV